MKRTKTTLTRKLKHDLSLMASYGDKTLQSRVAGDALSNDSEAINYLFDVINHGCVGGSCNQLIYYVDTHAFYVKYADEIDTILGDIKENTGEAFDMKAGEEDLRNRLAWLAYEETAGAILTALGFEI